MFWRKDTTTLLISKMNTITRIKTKPIKSLTIFLTVCLVVSVGMIVLFSLPFMAKEQWVIKILVWVFCSIFALAALIVLVNQLFFQVEVKGEKYIKHVLFARISIPIKEIDKVTNKDGFYTVIYKTKPFSSFAGNTYESQQIIIYLEKCGVKIDW